MHTRVEGGWGWDEGEIGTDRATLLCIKQITNENLLYRTGNSMLCGDLNGKEIQKRGVICIPPYMGFPGSSGGKEAACSAGDCSLIPGWGSSPGEGDRLHTAVFLGFPGGSD